MSSAPRKKRWRRRTPRWWQPGKWRKWPSRWRALWGRSTGPCPHPPGLRHQAYRIPPTNLRWRSSQSRCIPHRIPQIPNAQPRSSGVWVAHPTGRNGPHPDQRRKVNLWVKNMLDSLRRLHPVQHNVPAVWNHFEEAFWSKFMDSTKELWARNQLERLKFWYPDIDGYIAEFEDLVVQVGYNIASQEAINLFLKGFNKNRSLLDKVFTPPVLVTYKAMKRRLIAIIKSMQLVNSIAQDTPDFRGFRNNLTQMPWGNQQPQRNFVLQQVMLFNAPQWMNNQPVPMDTSNQAHAPNWRSRMTQGNVAQIKMNQWLNWPPCKCFNCDKVGHIAANCRAPKKARINYIIDEPEDMTNQQVPLTPDGILDNALTSFDQLSNDLKDQFIQKYEGDSQNFQGV